MAMGKGNHSTSQMKPGLTSWKPQGTKTPKFTRIGGRDSSAIQVEMARPVKVAKNGGAK